MQRKYDANSPKILAMSFSRRRLQQVKTQAKRMNMRVTNQIAATPLR